MGKRGFTLIELLIIIAIVSILAIIAIPSFIGQGKKAARSEAYANLQNLRLLEEQYFAENAGYTVSKGTCAKDNDNTAAIQTVLSGFKPGTQLNFSYCIEQNVDINSAVKTPCFRASAFGNSSTRVDSDVFRIDCDNNRNF